MSLADELLALKREFLVPCVYHFYRRPPAFVRGEGEYLIDADGRKYLDCYSGVTVTSAGHSNPEILGPAIDQLGALQHTTTIYLSEPMLYLAREIASLAPGNLKRSFFCASGSEANEGALLLSTLATGRDECVYLRDGLHGRTKWAMSVTGLDMWRTDRQPLAIAHGVPGPRSPDSLTEIERLLSTGRVASVIVEPIQGNGGIIVPPDDYLPTLRDLCTRHGALLIADEIQTAWNRTGTWFASSHWGVVPDIVTVAKALGNGFPIAAYVTTDAIAAHYTRPGAATYGGNLVSCSAALATLSYHKREKLGERSATLGRYLLARLQEAKSELPFITEVRGKGLMVGLELGDKPGMTGAILADELLEVMKDEGFLLGKTGVGRNVLTLMPPLIISKRQLDEVVDTLVKLLRLS